MSKEIKVKLVTAKALKLNSNSSYIVVIEPQFAEYADSIWESLTDVTGHPKHVVIPLPLDQIKFYEIEKPYTIQATDTHTSNEAPGEQKERV